MCRQADSIGKKRKVTKPLSKHVARKTIAAMPLKVASYHLKTSSEMSSTGTLLIKSELTKAKKLPEVPLEKSKKLSEIPLEQSKKLPEALLEQSLKLPEISFEQPKTENSLTELKQRNETETYIVAQSVPKKTEKIVEKQLMLAKTENFDDLQSKLIKKGNLKDISLESKEANRLGQKSVDSRENNLEKKQSKLTKTEKHVIKQAEQNVTENMPSKIAADSNRPEHMPNRIPAESNRTENMPNRIPAESKTIIEDRLSMEQNKMKNQSMATGDEKSPPVSKENAPETKVLVKQQANFVELEKQSQETDAVVPNGADIMQNEKRNMKKSFVAKNKELAQESYEESVAEVKEEGDVVKLERQTQNGGKDDVKLAQQSQLKNFVESQGTTTGDSVKLAQDLAVKPVQETSKENLVEQQESEYLKVQMAPRNPSKNFVNQIDLPEENLEKSIEISNSQETKEQKNPPRIGVVDKTNPGQQSGGRRYFRSILDQLIAGQQGSTGRTIDVELTKGHEARVPPIPSQLGDAEDLKLGESVHHLEYQQIDRSKQQWSAGGELAEEQAEEWNVTNDDDDDDDDDDDEAMMKYQQSYPTTVRKSGETPGRKQKFSKKFNY